MSPAEGPRPVVVELGRKKKKQIKKLRRGTGPLMDDLQELLAKLRASGDLAAGATPVFMIVKQKPKRSSIRPFSEAAGRQQPRWRRGREVVTPGSSWGAIARVRWNRRRCPSPGLASPPSSSASRAGLLLGMLGAALAALTRGAGRRLRRFFEPAAASGSSWPSSGPAPRHIRRGLLRRAVPAHRPRIGLPSRTSASWWSRAGGDDQCSRAHEKCVAAASTGQTHRAIAWRPDVAVRCSASWKRRSPRPARHGRFLFAFGRLALGVSLSDDLRWRSSRPWPRTSTTGWRRRT